MHYKVKPLTFEIYDQIWTSQVKFHEYMLNWWIWSRKIKINEVTCKKGNLENIENFTIQISCSSALLSQAITSNPSSHFLCYKAQMKALVPYFNFLIEGWFHKSARILSYEDIKLVSQVETLRKFSSQLWSLKSDKLYSQFSSWSTLIQKKLKTWKL